jgi:inner membrane protein
MDSLSQLALGAAVGIATMGRRTALWKAALWGGVCGTLPDLDAFIDHGDAIRNMTLHRAESHALFWQTLASPFIAAGIAALHREGPLFRRWWLAVWLALTTHALLDAMTVYGTQLGLPFTDHPYGVGSIFIIDPLYTLPLLIGVGVALSRADTGAALRWNVAGLVLSTAYLAWGVAAQHHVRGIAEAELAAQGIAADRVLVTPTPFNSVLWRIVAVSADGHHEGFHSLLDADRRITFDRFERGESLYAQVHGAWHVERIAWFSRGFFKMAADGDELRITDLRMGQEPFYTFSFIVAQRNGTRWQEITPINAGGRGDVSGLMRWLGPRVLGAPGAPPR